MEEEHSQQLLNGVVGLVNQMRSVSDGLYKHTYDLDTPLAAINQGVVASIDQLLQQAQGELPVSARLARFVEEKEASTSLVLEYVTAEEQRKQDLESLARGKSRYFELFRQEIAREIAEE